MSRRVSLMAAALLMMAAPRADACVPAPGWPGLIQLSPRSVAAEMVRAATYIDLVRVDDLTDDFDFASKSRPAWQVFVGKPPGDFRTVDDVLAAFRSSWDGAVRIHYRVLRSFKGRSAPTFVMSGERWPMENAGRPRPWGTPLQDLKYFLDQQDLAAWPSPGGCENQLFAAEGKTYLIFRDASGGVLRSPTHMFFKGRRISIPGPAHVAVTGEDDPWVRLVRGAIGRTKGE